MGQCDTGLLAGPQGTNKCEAKNGSVGLVLSISQKNFACRLYSVLLLVQASVTQNEDYLMFDNSHYLKTRAETFSTYY